MNVSTAHHSSAKRWLKRAVFALCVLLCSPFILIDWIERRLLRGEVIFTGLSHFLALLPGLPGTFIRAAFYWAALEQSSWEIHVGFGTIFTHRGVRLGKNVSMGAYCVIGHADIGEETMIGSRVSIPSGKRQHFDDHGGISAIARFDTVTVGRAVWIGEGAIVMADVGSHSVISAGAIVVQAMPERCIVGGNPARVLKELGPAASSSSSAGGGACAV